MVAASIGLDVPDETVDPERSTVEVMATDVAVGLVFAAVEPEATTSNATGIATEGGSEVVILRPVLIAAEVREPHDHVVKPAVAGGHENLHEGGPVRPHGDGEALTGVERVCIN